MSTNKISRREFLYTGVAAAAGAALVACQPQTIVIETEREVTKVVEQKVEKEVTRIVSKERKAVTAMFWDAVVPGYREEPLRKWDDTQDEYFFDYQWSPQYYDKLMIMVAGGMPPDLFILQTSWLPEFWKNKSLLDLQGYVDRDNYALDDFPKIAVDAYKWKGGFYGLPDNITGWCIYYNQRMFDEAGVGYYPTNKWNDEKWTTDDFLAACEKIQQRDSSGKVTHYGYDLSLGWLVLGIWMNLFGGSYVDDPLSPSECTLHEKGAIDAIQFLADLRWKYEYAPRPEAMAEMGSNEMVQNERLAMAIGGGWGFKSWAKYDFPWDIAHFPKGPVRRNNYTFYYPLCVGKDSDVPDGAWSLLKYYEDVAIKEIIQMGSLQGTRLSDMRDIFVTDPEPPESREVLADSVEVFGWLDPRLTNWNEIWNTIKAELDYVWIGEKSAEEACNAAKEAADPLVAAGRIEG